MSSDYSDLLRRAANSHDMQISCGILTPKVKINCSPYLTSIEDCIFNLQVSKYEFPLFVLDATLIFSGDTIYTASGRKIVVVDSYYTNDGRLVVRDENMINHHVDMCSVKLKTLMIELPLNIVNELSVWEDSIIIDEITATVAKACTLALKQHNEQ